MRLLILQPTMKNGFKQILLIQSKYTISLCIVVIFCFISMKMNMNLILLLKSMVYRCGMNDLWAMVKNPTKFFSKCSLVFCRFWQSGSCSNSSKTTISICGFTTHVYHSCRSWCSPMETKSKKWKIWKNFPQKWLFALGWYVKGSCSSKLLYLFVWIVCAIRNERVFSKAEKCRLTVAFIWSNGHMTKQWKWNDNDIARLFFFFLEIFFLFYRFNLS